MKKIGRLLLSLIPLLVFTGNAWADLGTEDWSVEFDSGPIGGGGGQDGHDIFYDVAVDSLDNMVFAGKRAEIWPTVPTNQSLFIQKHNPTGSTLLWDERWYGYGWVGAHGMAVDASDNIYVAGSDFVDWGSTQGAWLTMKYTSGGAITLSPICEPLDKPAQSPEIQIVLNGFGFLFLWFF